MSRDDWKRIKELFDEALKLDGEEREAFLARRCRSDAERAEVQELLRIHDDPEGLDLEPFGFSVMSLPRLELLEEVGSGGAGVVYRARDTTLNRIVAVKVLRTHPGLSRRDIEEFRAEAARVSRLRHPNIVTTHWVSETTDPPHFVMEYIPGDSLLDLLEEVREAGRMPPEGGPFLGGAAPSYFARVADIVARIAGALAYSHEQGIIHRDIKPNNVLIDESGQPFLVDFGIARDVDGETQGLPKGTLYYMSPEQARLRITEVDHRTDIYSLGVVCYELLTLVRPFEGDTEEQIFRAINEKPVVALRRLQPGVPRDLEVICLKAMEKDPDDRYEDAGELAEDLRRFLQGEAPRAQPAPLWRRVRAQVRAHRRIALGVAGVLLAVAGGVTGTALAGDPWPRVTLTVGDGSPEGHVLAWPVDPLLGTRAGDPPRDLGSTPLLEEPIPPGSYLLQVSAPGGRWAETILQAPLMGELHVLPALTIPASRDEGMVEIPGGSFAMGRAANEREPEKEAFDRDVVLEAFYVDRYETTIREYRAFLDAAPDQEAPILWPSDWRERWAEWEAEGITELPVTGVRAREAEAYASWAGKRLPSFAEWQRVARGPSGHVYPWEADLEGVREHINVGPGQDADLELKLGGLELLFRRRPPHSLETEEDLAWRWRFFLAMAEPPGARPDDVTPEGVADALGNVREWTWTPAFDFPKAPSEFEPLYGWRVTGGMCFSEDPWPLHEVKCSDKSIRDTALGFRCVRSRSRFVP